MFVLNIREILGVSVEGGYSLTFIDDLFFLLLLQSGCSWMFVHITLQDVSVRKGDLYAISQSRVFVVFT